MSRVVLITDNSDFERKIRLAGSAGEVLILPATAVASGPAGILPRLHGELPEVLLLGPGLPTAEALKLAAAFDLQYPQIILVLVAESNAEAAVAAMRAGIRDILHPKAEVDSIAMLLERVAVDYAARRQSLSDEADSAHRTGRIIGVLSPKGGVGKTTVATNLAVGLAAKAPGGVVIVDLDLQFGDVASGLALEPEATVVEAVNSAGSQDSMVLKSFLTTHPTGIYALCAPNSPAQADRISADQVSHLLSQLAEQFSYVVVDTAPGLGEHCLATLEQCTDVVWVCGMDVPSIRGFCSVLDVLTELKMLPPGQQLVLNFAHHRSGLNIRDVETAIGRPADVVLPLSRALPYSTNRGVPLLETTNRDAATRALRKLVDRFPIVTEAERPRNAQLMAVNS